jgi:hypothetical protein
MFAVSLAFHLCPGTAAEPGTFDSMPRGTVSGARARIRPPKRYREPMGLEERGS